MGTIWMHRYMCDIILCSVQEDDSGSYFCRASNIHLQRFLTSRRATLTVLGMTLRWTDHTVPLDTQTVASSTCRIILVSSWQHLHQWKCGPRCWRCLWVLGWCWTVRCPVTLYPPSAGWREATPSRPEARLLWGELTCCDFIEKERRLMTLSVFQICDHLHLSHAEWEMPLSTSSQPGAMMRECICARPPTHWAKAAAQRCWELLVIHFIN